MTVCDGVCCCVGVCRRVSVSIGVRRCRSVSWMPVSLCLGVPVSVCVCVCVYVCASVRRCVCVLVLVCVHAVT